MRIKGGDEIEKSIFVKWKQKVEGIRWKTVNEEKVVD